MRELNTPPRDIDFAIAPADAVCVYESDLDHPELIAALRAHGFTAWRTFRDGPARAVVVFRRAISSSASDISDRAHR
jgi:hypothetical protein